MIEDSSKLKRGEILKVNLSLVRDRLNNELIETIKNDPHGKLVGYKMVDGNQFGLVLEFSDRKTHWFFESELSEINEVPIDQAESRSESQ
tara:strand:+ start:71 stop:340 length:270 start_codon:yes stop_codon:yes gene_type:complete